MATINCTIPYSGGYYPGDGYVQKVVTAIDCSYEETYTDVDNTGGNYLSIQDNGGGNSTTERAYGDFDTSEVPTSATVERIDLVCIIPPPPDTHYRTTTITSLPQQKGSYASASSLFSDIGTSTALWNGQIHDNTQQITFSGDLGATAISEWESHKDFLMLGFVLDEGSPTSTREEVQIYSRDVTNDFYLVFTYYLFGRRRHSICHASSD